jgi:uncharacterized protein YcbK (DUF882 family)
MYKFFDESEFACKETGINHIKPELIHALDELRERCGFPFVITSGYRAPTHSAEVNKPNGPGTHSQGIAADIAVSNGFQRMNIVHEALKLGFPAIGIAKGFVHLDIRKTDTPVMWTY